MGSTQVYISKMLLIILIKRKNTRTAEIKHNRVRKNSEKVMFNTIVTALALGNVLYMWH